MTEEWIEQIAIDHINDPGSVLPEHLISCEFCKSAFNRISDLYKNTFENMAVLENRVTIEMVEQHISKNNRHVHYLRTIDTGIQAKSQKSPRNILAADSPKLQSQKAKVENLGVFSSSDGQLIVRIIKDRDGSVTLFLLSDKESNYKNVLVRILGMDQEYITDPNGSVRIGDIDLPDLEELGIEVRTATGSYDLKSFFHNSETLIGESEIILSGGSSKQVKMEIIPAGGLYSLKVTLDEHAAMGSEKRVKVMVVRNDQPPIIQSSVHGVALFQELQDPKTIQVNIFE